MTLQQRKLITILFSIACIVGAGVAIYFGYHFFQNRIKIFYIFSGYIVAVTGVVIFAGRLLIRAIFKV